MGVAVRPRFAGVWVSRFMMTILSCALMVTSKAVSNDKNIRVLSLSQALARALEKNHSLRQAGESLRASELRVKRSRADLLPRADLQMSYARLDAASVRRGNVFVDPGRDLVETFGGDPTDVRPAAYDNMFSTSIQVVQPIYNGGANWAALNVARAQNKTGEEKYEDVKQQVVLAVKTRYFQVLLSKELVALAQKNLEATEGHLKQSRNMHEVGVRDKTDLLRWEVQKANHEGDLVEAVNNLEVAFAALKQAIGMENDMTFDVEPFGLEPVPLGAQLDEQLGISKAKHPSLRALDASLEAQRAAVRLAAAAIQPKVNFVYQLSWEENNTLRPDSFSSWRAGVALNLPIFHSFKNIAGIQEAKAELRSLEESKREAQSAVSLNVIRARLKLETSITRFQIAKRASEQAEENLRILNSTYSVGLATNLDVLDAEVVHSKARADLINARYNYWIARAELDRATGVLAE